ncbi:MAG: hypothetical protein ACI9UN_003005 [Granulosicoccus sp.]|jgi:hypothetical protein
MLIGFYKPQRDTTPLLTQLIVEWREHSCHGISRQNKQDLRAGMKLR